MHSCNGSVGNVGSWVYWQWNFTLNRISPEVRLFLMEERELQKEICHKGLCIYWVDILLVFSWHLKEVHVSGREDVPQFPPSIALKLQQHLLALDIPLLLPDTSESKCYFPHPSQTIKSSHMSPSPPYVHHPLAGTARVTALLLTCLWEFYHHLVPRHSLCTDQLFSALQRQVLIALSWLYRGVHCTAQLNAFA